MLGNFAEEFATRHDINSLDYFMFFDPEDADRLIGDYNKGTEHNNQTAKIGALMGRKLIPFLFWIKDKERRQQDMEATDWTARQLKIFVDDWRSTKDRKDADEKSKPVVGSVWTRFIGLNGRKHSECLRMPSRQSGQTRAYSIQSGMTSWTSQKESLGPLLMLKTTRDA